MNDLLFIFDDKGPLKQTPVLKDKTVKGTFCKKCYLKQKL